MNVNSELLGLIGWMIACGVVTIIGALIGRRSLAKVTKDTS